MKSNIQRSLLIMPVNVPRFVEKAHLRGADAILLDLEDAVPPGEKDRARGLLEHSIELVGRGGADVLVRVNNDPARLTEDLECAVRPGVHAIFLPKTEHEEEVRSLEEVISRLEKARGMDAGSMRVSLHIESPTGLLRLERIAASGTRIESMSMGVDDYCLETGMEPSEEGTELLFPLSMLATVCKAAGFNPMGVLGSVADFSDAAKFERAAQSARRLGFTGAYCIHPGQVSILNRVFSPSPEKVLHARRVAAAFEESLEKGRATVSLDGKMVDPPLYKRACRVLEWAEAVEAREAMKSKALVEFAKIDSGTTI